MPQDDEDPLAGHPTYEKVRGLSKGGYGFVQLARLRDGTAEYAIKFLPRGCERVNKFLEREIMNHRQLWHPHIVKFHEVILTPEYLGIVMEYVPGGNLLSYLNWRQQRRAHLTEDDVRWIFQQLMIAIDYCHRLGVANRDIKLENTLLDDPHHLRPIIKLCDFGFAKDMNKSAPKTRVGTVHYMAPEVISLRRGNEYCGKCSDMWSCGVLLHTLFFGVFPFHNRTDNQLNAEDRHKAVIQRILHQPYQIPPYCRTADNCLKPVSPALRDLLQRILQKEPHNRLTMAELMNHPWFLKDLPMPALTMNHHLPPRPESSQSEDEVMDILMDAQTMPYNLGSIQSSDVDQLIDSQLQEELARLQLHRADFE